MTKNIAIALVFIIAPFHILFGQSIDVPSDVEVVIQHVSNSDSSTYSIVQYLFNSINNAISKTDSLSLLIRSDSLTDEETKLNKVINTLSKDILSVYVDVNKNSELYRNAIRDFKDYILQDGLTINDLIEKLSQDLSRQQNDLKRFTEIEQTTDIILMKIQGKENVISQIEIQLEYLKAFKKQLEIIRKNTQITEKDINVFLAAAEINEEVIRYNIRTLKLEKNVRSFLKTADQLTSIKKLSSDMLISVQKLNESVRKLLERAIRDLKAKSQSDQLF